MQTKVQYVFRSLDPYRLLTDLKVEMTSRDGKFYVPHPKLRNEHMVIDNQGLVSTAYWCDIVACHIFDYLRFCMGSYEEVISYLIEHYHHLIQGVQGAALTSLQPVMVEELKQQRKQFEEILALRTSLRKAGEGNVEAYMWCRARGIAPERAWPMFYLATAEQLNNLVAYSNESVDRLTESQYFVFPYLANPHTYGWLRIQPVKGSGTSTIPINPFKHGFFGLHTCLPQHRETHAHPDPATALVNNSNGNEKGEFLLSNIHIGFRVTGMDNPYRVPHAIFVRSSKMGLGTMVQARSALQDMSITDSKPEGVMRYLASNSQGWGDYILSEFAQIVQTEGYLSPKLTALIDSIKYDRSLCAGLLRFLNPEKHPEVYNRVKSLMDSHQVYEIGGMQIVETSSGYVAKRIGTGISTAFTNFIVKLDHHVWFEEAQDETLFCGRVLINGQEFPLLLPARKIASPTEIPNIIFNSVMKGGPPPAGCFPQIIDSTYQRRLADIIRAQSNQRSVLIGVKRLGWNDGRNRFVTPAWEARITGIAATSRIGSPASEFLNHYSFQEYSTIQSTEQVSSRIRYYMAILASGIVRSYLNMPVPAVSVLRSAESVRMLQAIFRPFGQKDPIPLGAQKRGVHSTLSDTNISGYPIFCSPMDASFLDELNLPAIVLADSGIPFHEKLDDVIFAQIASYSHDIFSKLFVFCLRNPFQVHSLIRNSASPTLQEMVFEGKNILEQACEIECFDIFEADMPLFQSVMNEVTFDTLKDYFRYDMPSQSIFIRWRKFAKHSRRDVCEELQAKNANVKLHGNFYIAGPSDFFLDLLSRFFGRPVQLFHQEAEADPEPMATQGDLAQSST